LINQELPKCLSCRLTGKSVEEKEEQALDFIYRVTGLSKSKYQVEDYEMQIVNQIAYFTRIKE